MMMQEGGVATVALLAANLTLTDTVHPLVLDGEPALFLEHEQQILGLNGSAGAWIARLIEGTTLEDLRLFAVSDRGGRSERQNFEQVLLEWSAKGIVAATIDWDDWRLGADRVRHLDAGPEQFEIHFQKGSFGSALAAPYGHLRGMDRGGRRVAVLPWRNLAVILLEGQQSRIVPREQAASRLRLAIVQSILACEGPVALHVACAVRHGEAILLCGAPGAGKSTLVRALAQKGFGVAGDDIALFDPASGKVAGVPLPLTLKLGNCDLLGSAGSLPEIRADGVGVRYAPLPAFAGSDWIPVRAIVDLDRTEVTGASLSAWSARDCVRKLFAEAHATCGRSSFDVVNAMIDLAARSEMLRVSYCEADAAACQMERHFEF